MQLLDVTRLLLGLFLFLQGMQILCRILERQSQSRLKGMITRLSSSALRAFLFGVFSTALLQSSTAVSVITLGLCSSGILPLERAAWVIVGSNIGTTSTAQLLRLSTAVGQSPFSAQLLYIALAVSFFFFSRNKNHKVSAFGSLLFGLTLLLFGMDTLERAVPALFASNQMQSLLLGLSDPALCALLGILMTIVLQSSSACVGILQALSLSGALAVGPAAAIIAGQNVGTCLTALLAASNAGPNGKRAALIHLAFNLLGVIVFIPLLYLLLALSPATFAHTASKGGIANIHLVQNALCTLLYIPLHKRVVALCQRVVPDISNRPI